MDKESSLPPPSFQADSSRVKGCCLIFCYCCNEVCGQTEPRLCQSRAVLHPASAAAGPEQSRPLAALPEHCCRASTEETRPLSCSLSVRVSRPLLRKPSPLLPADATAAGPHCRRMYLLHASAASRYQDNGAEEHPSCLASVIEEGQASPLAAC